jgi:predicted site-specific integrase-resolvase
LKLIVSSRGEDGISKMEVLAMDGLFSIGEMARRLGVAVVTLRRWDREGRLKPTLRTLGGHRRYGEVPQSASTRTVLYARVSSHDQKEDLERQKVRLNAYAEMNGWSDCEVISDLGSGLNFRKRGILRLLDLIVRGAIARLVIENKDRLLRFGADLLFRLCAARGIDVVIVEADVKPSFEVDLARDVLEIITVFSARLHGARSAGRKRQAAVIS